MDFKKKKTQKAPTNEIELAEKLKKQYFHEKDK
jgi:phage-related protein